MEALRNSGESGQAAVSQKQTICGLLAERFARGAQQPALILLEDKRLRISRWQDVVDRVLQMATILRRLGVKPGDRAVHLSENRQEWIYTDLALHALQAVHVPVHATLSGSQIVWQIRHSDAQLVVLSSGEQVGKLTACAALLPQNLTYLSYERCTGSIDGQPVLWLTELMASSATTAGNSTITEAAQSASPERLATILYTSGTTGEPKGVMLSEQNLVQNALAAQLAFDQRAEDVRLNFLPFSHIFARTCDIYTWLSSGSQLALARSRDTVLSDCRRVRPTLLNGVPYFYEKVIRTLKEQGEADSQDALQAAFGGRMRAVYAGGAPLPDYVFDFFFERDLPILQGYGLTEASPVICTSTLRRYRRGSVGPPVLGAELRLDSDGEILTRGPHVMLGYWKEPQATQETIRDGWLHTGDLGQIGPDGMLRITGRKKELLVTSGGRNVAPAYLESLLVADALIQQAVVVGDARPFLVALIVPDRNALEARLAAEHVALPGAAEISNHARVRILYEQAIRERLANVARHEQIVRFHLLPRAFSVEQGELTAKLSLRRSVIQQRYAAQIEAMYEEKDEG